MQAGKFGTLMSFLVVLVGVVVSIVTQQYAPDHINYSYWNDGCPDGYLTSCKANTAVLRISFAMTIFFTAHIIGTAILAKFFDYLWSLKFGIFSALVIGFFFAHATIFDTNGYAWVARFTGFLYLILQQIILLDVAYTWNERWVEYAGDDDMSCWLIGLLGISTFLFSGSMAAIGVMFWQFSGCASNDAILSLTVCLSAIATGIQLTITSKASLLTSAIMTSYATYICYSAIILNPDTSCNPTISTNYQTLSKVIGIVLTVISLSWTTFSTVNQVIPLLSTTPVGEANPPAQNLSSILAPNATGSSKPKPPKNENEAIENGEAKKDDQLSSEPVKKSDVVEQDPYVNPTLRALFIQVSLVLVLVSGYYAMILTNWATLQSNANLSNSRTGLVAMWLQASGQWIAIIIYIWSMIAPTVFPDRDFD